MEFRQAIDCPEIFVAQGVVEIKSGRIHKLMRKSVVIFRSNTERGKAAVFGDDVGIAIVRIYGRTMSLPPGV